jgi:hypothetical protein
MTSEIFVTGSSAADSRNGGLQLPDPVARQPIVMCVGPLSSTDCTIIAKSSFRATTEDIRGVSAKPVKISAIFSDRNEMKNRQDF